MQHYTDKPPSALVVTGNLAENWKTFRNEFYNYINRPEQSKESSETHVAIFLNCIGENGLKMFNNLNLTETEVENIVSVMKAFEVQCISQELNSQRSQFYMRTQLDNESIDDFLKSLKDLAKPCFFGNQEDTEVKYRLHLGLKDLDVKNKLENVEHFTLNDVINLCKSAELYKSQQMLSTGDGQIVVHQDGDRIYSNSMECVLQSVASINDTDKKTYENINKKAIQIFENYFEQSTLEKRKELTIALTQYLQNELLDYGDDHTINEI